MKTRWKIVIALFASVALSIGFAVAGNAQGSGSGQMEGRLGTMHQAHSQMHAGAEGCDRLHTQGMNGEMGAGHMRADGMMGSQRQGGMMGAPGA